jgi:hypothetical protein
LMSRCRKVRAGDNIHIGLRIHMPIVALNNKHMRRLKGSPGIYRAPGSFSSKVVVRTT